MLGVVCVLHVSVLWVGQRGGERGSKGAQDVGGAQRWRREKEGDMPCGGGGGGVRVLHVSVMWVMRRQGGEKARVERSVGASRAVREQADDGYKGGTRTERAERSAHAHHTCSA